MKKTNFCGSKFQNCQKLLMYWKTCADFGTDVNFSDICLQGGGRGRTYVPMVPSNKNGSKTFNGKFSNFTFLYGGIPKTQSTLDARRKHKEVESAITLQMGVFTLDASNINGIAHKFACSCPVWTGPDTHTQITRTHFKQHAHALALPPQRPLHPESHTHTTHMQPHTFFTNAHTHTHTHTLSYTNVPSHSHTKAQQRTNQTARKGHMSKTCVRLKCSCTVLGLIATLCGNNKHSGWIRLIQFPVLCPFLTPLLWISCRAVVRQGAVGVSQHDRSRVVALGNVATNPEGEAGSDRVGLSEQHHETDQWDPTPMEGHGQGI